MRLYKKDERCLFLYVHSDDFQMYFPSENWRQSFYEMVKKMTADQDGNQDLESEDNEPIMFEYDYDEQNRKIVLGKGEFISNIFLEIFKLYAKNWSTFFS